MSVRIEIFHEDAGGAMDDLKRLAATLGVTFMASQGAPVQPAADVKPAKGKKGAAPVVEQPNGTAEEQVPMFPDKQPDPLPPVIQVESAKPAEAEVVIDEAACRAALQFLHSVHAGKKDSPGGVKAARMVCEQFGVKKVSELKPEQYKPFHDATHEEARRVQAS